MKTKKRERGTRLKRSTPQYQSRLIQMAMSSVPAGRHCGSLRGLDLGVKTNMELREVLEEHGVPAHYWKKAKKVELVDMILLLTPPEMKLENEYMRLDEVNDLMLRGLLELHRSSGQCRPTILFSSLHRHLNWTPSLSIKPLYWLDQYGYAWIEHSHSPNGVAVFVHPTPAAYRYEEQYPE